MLLAMWCMDSGPHYQRPGYPCHSWLCLEGEQQDRDKIKYEESPETARGRIRTWMQTGIHRLALRWTTLEGRDPQGNQSRCFRD